MRAGWGLGVVALIAAGGLLAGIAVGSAPGARPVVTRVLGVLPDLLRPGQAGVAQAPPAATSPFPTVPSRPGPAPYGPSGASATPAPTSTPSTSPRPTPMTPTSSMSPSPAPTDAPPCAPTVRACVDLSANRSWLLRDGRVTYGPVPVAHGRTGFRTPPGTFRVAFKNRDHVSSIYDAEMPYSVFFNGGIAFHEGSLTSSSHGCVRLSPAAARTYFATLAVGDVVQVVH